MYNVTVCGIPCQIEVHSYYVESESWDCPGSAEWEFALYDRKGYRAKWLERKLEANPDEEARLFEQHGEYLIADAADRY